MVLTMKPILETKPLVRHGLAGEWIVPTAGQQLCWRSARMAGFTRFFFGRHGGHNGDRRSLHHSSMSPAKKEVFFGTCLSIFPFRIPQCPLTRGRPHSLGWIGVAVFSNRER